MWYVDSNVRDSGRPLTVVSVGKRWAALARDSHSRPYMRVDIATDMVDGGKYSSPGKVWESREAYENHASKIQQWDELRKLCSQRVPDHLSLNDLQDIASKICGRP